MKLLNREIMKLFPSHTYISDHDFKDWVANNVTMEQTLGVCGFLFQKFCERDRLILRDIVLTQKFNYSQNKRFRDKKNVERYINLENISEFFLLSADASSEHPVLQVKLAEIIGFSWELTATKLFPSRRFESEVVQNLYDESGVCVTISELT